MTLIYKIFSYLGIMSVAGAFIYGFRYDPAAPMINYAWNLGLFCAFFFVHAVMMQPWFKKLITGGPEGGHGERRTYIIVAIVTWLALYAVHFPVPGPALVLPAWAGFLGLCLALLGSFAALELADFEGLNGTIGAPGSDLALSLSPDTPLMTEGAYARVRHPAYQGLLLTFVSTVIMHPTMAQVFWALMVGLTILVFVPIEESQLRKSRGEEYAAYAKATRYRIIPGIW